MGYRQPKPRRRDYGSWEDYQNAVDVWKALHGGHGKGSGWSNQSNNSNASVKVSGGYNRRSHGNYDPSAQRTDVEIFDKTAQGGLEKTHLSIDSDGNRTVWNGNESFGE